MNICDVRTRWINVDRDTEKVKSIIETVQSLTLRF